MGIRDFAGKAIPFRSRFGNQCTNFIFKVFFAKKRPETNRGASGKHRLKFFYHPDYTVGTGIAPVRESVKLSSQTLLPVGNCTPPQRITLNCNFIIVSFLYCVKRLKRPDGNNFIPVQDFLSRTLSRYFRNLRVCICRARTDDLKKYNLFRPLKLCKFSY